MLIRCCQRLGELGLALAGDEQALAERGDRADADVLGDRPEREDAVGLAVAGDQRHRRRDLDAAARRRDAPSKMSQEQLRLAVPGKAGKADDLALDGRRARRRRSGASGRARTRTAVLPRAASRLGAVRGALAGARCPSRWTSLSRSKASARSAATTLPSRMTTTRSECCRISPRRCEIRMQLAPVADDAADEGEELAGGMGVERGGRLVEDDEVERVVGDGEGARDLDHLAAADREVADDVGRRRCRGRERSRRAWRRISSPARRRQPKPESARCMMRAFSATVRFGQSESSWKTQRMPSVWARATE